MKELHLTEDQSPLLRLCIRFIVDGQKDAGKEALRYLNASEETPADLATTCLGLLLRTGPSRTKEARVIQDDILSGLLRRSTAAKAALAEWLQQRNTSVPFEDIYSIGDGAAEAIATVVLSPEVWATEEARDICEKDVFMLYVAKLLEVGDDDNSRAMKCISRLLTTDGRKLQSLVDEDIFDMILSCLDYRNPMETKSPATLATAKFLEAAEDRGQVMLTRFVTTRYARQTTEDLILAFSAAAAVFPIATPIAASLFLIKDFLPSLGPLLDKKANSRHVGAAALEMLSAACVDSTCRENIKKYCLDWVRTASKSKVGQASMVASVVLAKIHNTPSQDNGRAKCPEEIDVVVNKLTQLLFKDPKNNRNSVFEGLAHQSVRPFVKEKLANDKRWLQIFIQEIRQAAGDAPAVFGGLVIVDNLTAYLPVLSEEQKHVAQLEAYANATPSSTSLIDPLDGEPAVSRRCEAVINAGIVSTIVGISKKLSSSSLALAFKIMLSTAKIPKLRGTMAQQGAVNMLANTWNQVKGTPTQMQETRQNSSQALARVLISVDPSILFGANGNSLLQSAIIPLVSLLSDDLIVASEGPRNFLPAFEALLALTNLSSVPTNGAPGVIMKKARSTTEDFMLSNNVNMRRAATELMSNLVQHPVGVILYADGSPEAAKRLHILLALAGSEDLGTRKAAGGALAALTGFAQVIEALNKQERGMELLVAMLDDENDDMIHRAVVCVLNILSSEDPSAQDADLQLQELPVKMKLKANLKKVESPDVLEVVRKALEMLG